MTQASVVKQFLENRNLVLGFIFALTRNYEVAEEIFQEVAVAILEEANKQTEVGNFMAWAREIARRRVANHYRTSAKRRATEQLSESLGDVVSQGFVENEKALEGHQTRMKYLLECLERLAGRSREVIEGYYRQRKSVRDIATDLAWQENSVKVALSRARKVLADCIQTKLDMRPAN